MAGPSTSPVLIITPFQIATWKAAPSWNLGLILSFSQGASLRATVLVTGDPSAATNPDALSNPHDVLLNQLSSISSNVAFPIVGLKLFVDSYISGECNLGISQWP
jgi:hypothetical protein